MLWNETTYTTPENEAYVFLRAQLRHIGEVRLVGSARRGLAYSNGHDFDITIDTDLESKSVVRKELDKVIPEWDSISTVPLHIMVYGDFDEEYFMGSLSRPHSGAVTQFIPTNRRSWCLLKTLTAKKIRYLWKTYSKWKRSVRQILSEK